MYLSTVLVDVGHNPDRPRPGRLWLRNRYRVHQRLCMGFPSGDRRENDPEFLQPFDCKDFGHSHVHVSRAEDAGFLYRVDPQGAGRVVILVQSAISPDWGYAFQNATYLLAAPPELKPFTPHWQDGERVRFRLEANPTRKVDTKTGPDGARRHGRRVPVREEHLAQWFVGRARDAGLAVDETTLLVQAGYINASKGRDKSNIRLRSARYDGAGTVVHAGDVAEVVASGIGPAKAFGFGLLSLAPA